jgi:hypothetical protein
MGKQQIIVIYALETSRDEITLEWFFDCDIMMTTSEMKIGVKLTPETLCTSNIPQTMDNVQCNISIRTWENSYENYIKMFLRERSYEDLKWTKLTVDRVGVK